MEILIIVIPILLLVIVVEIGAIALKMTGIDIKTARFQSLSAFTGTGFTTKEAEDVVTHPQRRRIIMTLIFIGFVLWALLVSFIINALFTKHEFIPFLVQTSIILVVLVIFYALTTNKILMRKFRKSVETVLERRTRLRRKKIEAVIRLAQNFGVAEILLKADSPNINKTLAESTFRQREILVFAIERDKHIIPAPKAADILMEGDNLICYGKLENMAESS
ncbi:MAG: TrkA C-terminal domain-containing protein [Candidatus Omnitrophota bacterium]